jgi:hypothetical protein
MSSVRITNLPAATGPNPTDLFAVDQSNVTRKLSMTQLQTETVYAIVDGAGVALDPANGTIQTWTLGANRSPTDSFVAGQSMTLMVNDGAGYTITWPSVTWVGTPPVLATSGFNVIVLWKVSTTLYGRFVGST